MNQLLLIAFLFAPVQAGNGVVTGRLLSSTGQSISEIRVNAMAVPDAAIAASNVPTLVSFGLTDSNGNYRLENIPPGRYYISAGLVGGPTFYPGVATMGGSTAVSVVAGAVVSGIDFPLTVPVGFTVSGQVKLLPGPPPAFREARLIASAGTQNSTVTLSADGTFQFVRIQPGIYILLVSAGGPTPTMRIEVADKDVTGIEVIVARTVLVTGTIAVEGGGLLSLMILNFVPLKGGTSPTVVRIANGVLRAQLPEGEYQLTWSSLPEGYTIASIRAGTLDLLRNTFRIDFGKVPDPIQVTLRSR